MEIEPVEEFEKDIRKLKKFRTIKEDIEVFKKAIKYENTKKKDCDLERLKHYFGI